LKYGIIADTHNRLLPSLLAALEGVVEVWHAGDFCRQVVLEKIKTIAPVVAVHGNCDDRALVKELPAERWIEREGFSVLIVHGHAVSPMEAARQRPVDLVVFGHIHAPYDVTRDGVRYFNPGTAGGLRHAPSAGILTIEDGQFQLEHVEL
jgi:putative phosphoesterase